MRLRMICAQGGVGAPEQTVSLTCAQHEIAQWTFKSAHSCADPFNSVVLDALITGPNGRCYRVPGFWAGGDLWRIRFAPPMVGRYSLTTECSDAQDHGLHQQQGELIATPYRGSNPLLQHGPLSMAAGGGHLAHADGLPFLWLGDTWWLGLTQRFGWPETFQTLVQDRRSKGFNVIQLLGGLPCDMPAHDPRGSNEGGLAWEPDYARINPAFFDWADLRFDWLVAEGLVPCLFGAWSFYLQWLGIERMKQHWRYLIARYGAYPLIWCLSGGGTMPYYLSEDKEGDREVLRRGWTQLAHYVRSLDPYPRPLALHRGPRRAGGGELSKDVPCDLSMNNVRSLLGESEQDPAQECSGEVCSPGMLTIERHALHRRSFWISMLSGASGFTYGVSGIWQAGSRDNSFGPSPTGHTWPNTPWDEAMRLSSADQVGLGKALLERYRWWAFTRHPEWVARHNSGSVNGPYAAGIPAEVRVIYFPESMDGQAVVQHLEPEVAYQARFVNPQDGGSMPLGLVTGEPCWAVPPLPDAEDWLLILERAII